MAEGRPKSRFFAPHGFDLAMAIAAVAPMPGRKINDMVRGTPTGNSQHNSSGNGSHPVSGGGAKERARRLAKIEAGQIKRANGLEDA